MTLSIGDHLVIYRQKLVQDPVDKKFFREGEFTKVEGEMYHEFEVIEYGQIQPIEYPAKEIFYLVKLKKVE